MTRISALALSATLSASAFAHEGHGLPGASHWHSTDAIGYVLAAAIIGALWLTRGGK
jgi:hypothetical protein